MGAGASFAPPRRVLKTEEKKAEEKKASSGWRCWCGAASTARCGNCRARHYCSLDHQKADWPLHKLACPIPPISASVEFRHGAKGVGVFATRDIGAYETIGVDGAIVSCAYSGLIGAAALAKQVVDQHPTGALEWLSGHRMKLKAPASYVARICPPTLSRTERAVLEVATMYEYQWKERRGSACSNHIGLFPALSMVNHSCEPNTVHTSFSSETVLIAIEPIRNGQELTVSYVRHTTASPTLRDQVRPMHHLMFGGPCACGARRCIEKDEDKTVNTQLIKRVEQVTNLAPKPSKIVFRIIAVPACRTVVSNSAAAEEKSAAQSALVTALNLLAKTVQAEYPDAISDAALKREWATDSPLLLQMIELSVQHPDLPAIVRWELFLLHQRFGPAKPLFPVQTDTLALVRA